MSVYKIGHDTTSIVWLARTLVPSGGSVVVTKALVEIRPYRKNGQNHHQHHGQHRDESVQQRKAKVNGGKHSHWPYKYSRRVNPPNQK